MDNKKTQIYGKYSMGSGSVLLNPENLFLEIDNSDAIESYKISIKRDLAKAGIPLAALRNYTVMDVGTGRQAIAFYELGAKKVMHYDLSKENVAKMHEFIKRKKLEDRISSECVDLVNYNLPKNYFDLVFLHGIVQHFSNVTMGLMNCLEAVKKDGYASLYFYRSGTFYNFVVYLMQDLIKQNGNYREYFINSIILYSQNFLPNKFVSDLMDSTFISHIHLYVPDSYIAFVEAFGFDIISSSKLDPYGKKVDHIFAHPSVVINLKKVSQSNYDKNILEILSPDKSVNQLDLNNYSPIDKDIIQTINDFNLLKQTIDSKKIPPSVVMCLVFRIFNFLYNIDFGLDRKINGDEGEIYHKQLQLIFNNFIKLIELEF